MAADRDAVRVSVTIVVLGTLAVAFTFIAYATRIKAEEVSISPDGICSYPNKAAVGLGVVAALFLLAEQTVVSAATGCICCGGHRCHCTCAGVTATILFILSWCTFTIAFAGLIITSIVNSGTFLTNAYPGKHNNVDEAGDCYDVGRSSYMFLGEAIWSIISIVLGLITYIIFRASAPKQNIQTGSEFTNGQGIAMGHPSTEAK